MKTASIRPATTLSLLWQAEVEAYLREIGPTIPALSRAMALFGGEALELWVGQVRAR